MRAILKTSLMASAIALAATMPGIAMAQNFSGSSQFSSAGVTGGSYAKGIGDTSASSQSAGKVYSFNSGGTSSVEGLSATWGGATGPGSSFASGVDFSGSAWQGAFSGQGFAPAGAGQ